MIRPRMTAGRRRLPPPASHGLGGLTAAFVRELGALLARIPSPWVTVWLHFESDDPAWFGTWGFTRDPGPEVVVRPFPDVDLGVFRRLWTAMRALDPPLPWTSLDLTVQRGADGEASFQTGYGYDPVPIEDQLERVERWQASFVPPGGQVVDDGL